MSENAATTKGSPAGEAVRTGRPQRVLRAGLVAIPLWLLLLAPSLVYVLHLSDFGSIPHNDYYTVLRGIAGDSGMKLDPKTLLTLRSNEHVVTLPALAYVLNILVAHGDNRGLSIIALLLLTIVFVLLRTLLPTELKGLRYGPAAVGFGLVLSAFVFTPLAAHNVVMGFSGTMWFMSNAFAVAAIAFLVRRSRRPSTSPFLLWPVSVLGVLGAISYSTNLTLWPALLIGGLVLGLPRRQLLLPVATGAAVYLLYFLTYNPPAHHPELETTLWVLIRFLATYLGALFSGETDVAPWFGGLGLILSALFVLSVLVRGNRETRQLIAPWLMIQIFALGNALGTASARSGLGLQQALASRYASLQSLFWIGLLLPAGVILWRRQRWQSATSPTGFAQLGTSLLLVVFLLAPMYHRGVPYLMRMTRRAQDQPLAAIALRYNARDDRILQVFARWPQGVLRVSDFMRKVEHVPFNPGPGPAPGELLESRRIGRWKPDKVVGFFDGVERLESSGARVRGWAFSPQGPVERIFILNQSRVVVGEAVMGFRRADVAKQIHPEATHAGWRGYARTSAEEETLRAYAQIPGGGKLLPLQNAHTLSADTTAPDPVPAGR